MQNTAPKKNVMSFKLASHGHIFTLQINKMLADFKVISFLKLKKITYSRRHCTIHGNHLWILYISIYL